MEFGEKLAQYRQAANLTLREFAREVGYDASNVSKVERGKIHPPAAGLVLRKWGMVLGLEMGSEKLEDFVACGLAVRIRKTTITDAEIDKLMPAFFRTIGNKKLDPASYEKLKAILRSNM